MQTISVELREWQSKTPETCPDLAGTFLENDSVIKDTARRLREAEMLDVTELRSGIQITATSFVGRISLGKLQVTIHPKLESRELLHLLRYAYGFRNLELLDTTEYSTETNAFQDLLGMQLSAEVSELWARGLHRAYQERREHLAVPRGRVDFQSIVRRGRAGDTTLPCAFYLRQEDCPLNQILLAGLQLAAYVVSDTELKTIILQLARLLQEFVTSVPLSPEFLLLANRDLNRLTASYEPALKIIELLTESAGTHLQRTDHGIVLPGFLFNMNKFFQALLFRFLSDHLPGHSVQGEYRLRGMMSYLKGYNPLNRAAPTPRPDFAVMKGNTTAALLDAKYRDLFESTLPRDMLYQLAIYALSDDTQKSATILYPTTNLTARESKIEIREPLKQIRRGLVNLRPVKLNVLASLLNERGGSQLERNKKAYAQWLAFGDSVVS
jgi:5-methylcytosine-specific restriction enzyme subunit McrC